MAHFAQLDENDIVIFVTPLNDSYLLNEKGVETEQKGIDYLKSVHGQDTIWVQTSYNNNFRNVYAGVGQRYDREKDEFITERPEGLDSWVWHHGDKCWRPPIPRPILSDTQIDAGFVPHWFEEEKAWKILQKPPEGPA